jgi:hypothetical protein
VLLNDDHHRFTYPDDKSEEAIAVELKSTRFGENKPARLGDRGECARCRNGDLLMRRCENDFSSYFFENFGAARLA